MQELDVHLNPQELVRTLLTPSTPPHLALCRTFSHCVSQRRSSSSCRGDQVAWSFRFTKAERKVSAHSPGFSESCDKLILADSQCRTTSHILWQLVSTRLLHHHHHVCLHWWKCSHGGSGGSTWSLMQSELKWGNMYAVCSCEQAAESGLFYQQILTAFVSDYVYYRLRECVVCFCRSVFLKK